MKNSLFIIGFFVLGLSAGRFHRFPGEINVDKLGTYALFSLMIFAGITIGSDPSVWKIIRSFNYKILFVPVFIVLGTITGTFIFIQVSDAYSAVDIMAVGFGFGYYSLSSIILSEIASETIGVIALLTNIIRELLTLLLAPLLPRVFGKLSIIASGGATAMDTTLPVVIKYSGKEYGIIAVFSGIILSLMVPVLIPLLYQFT